MPRPQLTDEQRTAVIERSPRIFIEANPGSGKTTVAAERFGLIRFDQRAAGSQATAAVSFTRSATSELHRRIQGRWGSSAVFVAAWGHDHRHSGVLYSSAFAADRQDSLAGRPYR